MNDDLFGLWTDGYYTANRNGRYYTDDVKRMILDHLEKSDYYTKKAPEPTIEDKVVDIVKGGFEEKFGITIQEFQEVYERLVETDPQRLI